MVVDARYLWRMDGGGGGGGVVWRDRSRREGTWSDLVEGGVGGMGGGEVNDSEAARRLPLVGEVVTEFMELEAVILAFRRLRMKDGSFGEEGEGRMRLRPYCLRRNAKSNGYHRRRPGAWRRGKERDDRLPPWNRSVLRRRCFPRDGAMIRRASRRRRRVLCSSGCFFLLPNRLLPSVSGSMMVRRRWRREGGPRVDSPYPDRTQQSHRGTKPSPHHFHCCRYYRLHPPPPPPATNHGPNGIPEAPPRTPPVRRPSDEGRGRNKPLL